MQKKKIIGAVILILGIVMAIYGLNARGRLSRAKEGIGAITSPFSDKPFGKAASDVLEGKISKYDTIVTTLIVGGVIFIFIGGLTWVTAGRKKR